ncbi:MAG: hypothetical protein JEY99_16950, partial [Spirochaetales bacterium]|nr:hypothetical protein [Spirochaetales bacterium]
GLDTGTGDLVLSGATDIVDADRTLIVSGNDLYFNSGTVGGNTVLSADIDTLTIHLITNTASLTVNETDGIILTDVDTFDGNISITAASGDIAVVDVDDLNGGNRVTLDSLVGAITDGGGASPLIFAAQAELLARSGIGSGDALETAVGDIAAEIENSGNLQIDNTGALTVTTVGGTTGVVLTDFDTNDTGGSVNLTASGTITVSSVVNNQDGGNISLDANGAASSLLVQATVDAVGTGNVILTGDNDLGFTAAGDVTSVTGNISLTADADNGGPASGTLTLADGAVLNGGSGTVTLLADGDITLGRIVTTNVGVIAVSLTSREGSIIDGGDLAGEDIDAAGRLVIDAVTGIGTAGAIDTTVGSIDLDNTGSNNIDINETNALDIQKITQGGAGSVNVDAGGNITVLVAGTGIVSTGGQIELDANGVGIDISVNDVLTSAGGAVNVLADDAVSFGASGDVTSGDGTVTVDAGTGAITMDNNTLVNAGAGFIDFDAAGDITLGGLLTTNGTVTSVSLTSTAGGVVDGGAAAVDVVSSGRLVIDAVTGIGTAGAIDTTVASIALDNTGSNNIDINESNALDIQNINQGGAGSVNVDAGGNITVLVAGTGLVSTGGLIELDANGAGVDIAVNQTVGTGGGALNLLADDAVSFGASGDVTSGDGKVTVDAGTGAITMDNNTLVNAGAGLIDFDAAGDITLGGLLTTNGTVTSVSLTSTAGGVVDGGAAAVDVVSSGRLVIDAVTGIGTAGAIDTTVASIALDNTGSNNIDINESNALDIQNINQGGAGSVNVDAGGNITVLVGGTGLVSNGGQIELDANGAGVDIAVNQTVGTGGGVLNLLADDSVSFGASGDVTSANGTVTVDAGTGAITMADDALINAGAGLIDFDAAGDITLGGLFTTNGTVTSITINTPAGVIDAGDNYIDVASSGRLVIDAVTGIGSGGTFTGLETTVASIDLDNTTSGNLFINETDTLTVIRAVIAAGGGDLAINVTNNDLDINGPVSTTTGGDISLATGDGTINIAAAVATAGTGTINMTAGDSGSSNDNDLNIQTTVNGGTGKITLTSDRNDVNFTAAGDITATGGEIEVNAGAANTGLITMADGTILDCGNGIIDLNATDDINLGQLITTSVSTTAGSEAVNITTSGALLDGGNTGGEDVQAGGRLAISAANGIGATDWLETAVASAIITNSSGNPVRILETDDIDFIGFTQTTALSEIESTSGDITISGTFTSSGLGSVDITASGPGNITATAQINSGTGPMHLTGTTISIGASGAAADLLTEDGIITLTGDMELIEDVLIDTTGSGVGSGAAFSISGAVDDDLAATEWDLEITTTSDVSVQNLAGTVTFDDVLGGLRKVNSLTITADSVTLNGIGDSGNAGTQGNVTVETYNWIILESTLGGYYRSTLEQSYISRNQAVAIQNITADLDFGSDGGLSPQVLFNELYVDFDPDYTITFISDIATNERVVFYRGTLTPGVFHFFTDADNDGGGDMVIYGGDFGAGTYSDYDEDLDITDGSNEAFVFETSTAFLRTPLVEKDARFGDLAGSTLAIGKANGAIDSIGTGNFYVNGTDLIGSSDWSLYVKDLSTSNPLGYNDGGSYDDSFTRGTIHNLVFNATVTNCSTVIGGNIGASEVVTAGTDDNNVVIDGGNNQEYLPASQVGWDFDRPEVATFETVFDDIIRVTFSEPMENSNNQISAAVANFRTNGGTIPFTETYIDDDATPDAPPYNFTTTDGEGDLSTFYLYVPRATLTWNTDATGTTYGDADNGSTDRDGNHQTSIPDLSFLKGVFFDAGGHNPVRNYNENGADICDGTGPETFIDSSSPVLIAVAAGRADHDPAASDEPYDAHNFLHLRYSEKVNIGTEADYQIGAATPVENGRANETFDADGEHGAHIYQNGTDVEVVGFFTYPGVFNSGSRDADPAVTSIYRGGPENPSGDYGLTLYLAGWRSDASSLWTGYLGDPSQTIENHIPNTDASIGTLSAAVVENTRITDASGNAQEPSSEPFRTSSDSVADPIIIDDISNMAPGVASGTIAMPGTHLERWDVECPYFADYSVGISGWYEVLLRDGNVDGFVDSLDIHIQDNYASNRSAPDGSWDSEGDHPQATSDSAAPNHPWGIRDETVQATIGNDPTPILVEEVGISTPVNIPSAVFNTVVNQNLFDPVENGGDTEVNRDSDSYFSIEFDAAALQWDLTIELYLEYDASVGLFTDLAGNLIPSSSDIVLAIERILPTFQITIIGVDTNKIYVRFSEQLYREDGSTPEASDFEVSDGYTIDSIEKLTDTGDNSIRDAFFYLDSNIDEEFAFSGTIGPADNSNPNPSINTFLKDQVDNFMSSDEIHKITDIGIGVVEPVYADDGINSDDAQGGISPSLKVFDGTGRLLDRDITLESTINVPSATTQPIRLFYDVDVPDTMKFFGEDILETNFWMPKAISGLQVEANDEARTVPPFRSTGAIRDFLLPADDSEIKTGADVEFILTLGDLICARLTDPSDPRSLAPWSFSIDELVAQSGGVTIVNNVINPNESEEATLFYELAEAGMVTINVFNLAGDLVDTIFRGRQGTGSYTFHWGGKNHSGDTVARGVYLIRLVAPGVDEFRKVLVVK